MRMLIVFTRQIGCLGVKFYINTLLLFYNSKLIYNTYIKTNMDDYDYYIKGF